MSQNNEEKQNEASEEVKTTVPTNTTIQTAPSTPAPEVKPTETAPITQQPPTESVKEIKQNVKSWQIIIVIAVIIAFSFGLILLYDKQFRQRVIEAFNKRFKKQ